MHRDPSAYERNDARRFLAATIAALVAHLLLLAVLAPLLVRQSDDAPSTVPLNAFELFAVYERAEEEPREDAASAVQFVALPPPEQEERPDEARFRDQYERRVDEETVSADDPIGPEGGTPAPAEPVPPPPQRARAPAADRRPRADRTPPDEPAEPAEARQDDQETSPHEQPREETTAAVPEGPAGAPDDGDEHPGTEAGEVAPSVDFRTFRPTPERVGRLGGPGGSRSDYLDLPEGERTQINSLTSLYWGFFQRMREALLREWDPVATLRRHDPTRELYGTRDRYTVLQVTLNSDGSLRHAIVERSSGLDFLDHEAIRAFQVAAPFPNVPEGMKDLNGRAEFRFGFYVHYNRRTARIQWFE